MRAIVRTEGQRAHAARSWHGVNAIHRAGEALRRLEEYRPRRVAIDGCEYREGLNAVSIRGGVAGIQLERVGLGTTHSTIITAKNSFIS